MCGSRDFLEIVRDQLHQLNVDKSTVPGGIHPTVLMELADVMARPLLIIHQISLESGEVPADLKVASVIPIHKKDCYSNLSSWKNCEDRSGVLLTGA